LQAWLTIAELFGELQQPNFARMIFCSVVMVRRGGALRHPDRSAPRLASRFAVRIQDTSVRLSFS
jgi:hypothetical protein